MTAKDLKKYIVYLPIRWENQAVFVFIESLIPGWLDDIWFDKNTKRYSLRFFYGEKHRVRFPTKTKHVFRYMPTSIWINLSTCNVNELNKNTWNWIKEQRKIFNSKTITKRVLSDKNSMLDI